LVVRLKSGREIVYGPCLRPVEIDRLWWHMLDVASDGACRPNCWPGGKPPPGETAAPDSSAIPLCEFEIGDIVERAGGGAAVPPLGRGVTGTFDGPDRSGSITIETGLEGLVTITSELTGEPPTVEVCSLA
jgi:hypothetical protein